MDKPFSARKCAWCGIDKGSITPMSFICNEARKAGVDIAPTGSYLHPRCARRVQAATNTAILRKEPVK